MVRRWRLIGYFPIISYPYEAVLKSCWVLRRHGPRPPPVSVSWGTYRDETEPKGAGVKLRYTPGDARMLALVRLANQSFR
jgi:hypothetical protein